MGSERLAHGEDDGAAPGILRLGADAIAEAIELAHAAVALGVGVDVGGTQHPAADVLGHAELPVVVVPIVHALELEHAVVSVEAPTAAEVPSKAEVDIARVLRIRHAKVVTHRIEVLE